LPEPVRQTEQPISPPGAPAVLHPAAPLSRFLAFAVDVGLVSAVLSGALAVLGAILAAAAGAGQGLRELAEPLLPDWAMNLGLLGLLLIALFGVIACLALFDAYFIYYEYNHGTTPGKRMFGLAVATLDGGRPSLGQCVVREILRHVDCLLVLPGLLSLSFTRRHQRLGDLLASTWVIRDPAALLDAEPLYLSRTEYRRFRDVLLHAGPIPEPTRHEYLSVAYPSLALGFVTLSAEARARWRDVARAHFASLLAEPLDEDTVLRLFAELCVTRPLGSPTLPREAA